MPFFALTVLRAVRRMNHLFRIKAVISWWVLHSCVITQVSLKLCLGREICLFIFDVVSALTTAPFSSLDTAQPCRQPGSSTLMLPVEYMEYWLLSGWGRSWLCLGGAAFPPHLAKKGQGSLQGDPTCGQQLQPQKAPLSCHKGGNFVSSEPSCSLTPHTEENAKIITIWGTSHIPFFVLVLLPFCSEKKPFITAVCAEEPL